jgi:hypothetical protein
MPQPSISIVFHSAQHSMHCISLGVLPRFLHEQQTNGQNRTGSYLGLMVQPGNSRTEVGPFHAGDVVTMSCLQQIAHINKSFTAKQKEYDTRTN